MRILAPVLARHLSGGLVVLLLLAAGCGRALYSEDLGPGRDTLGGGDGGVGEDTIYPGDAGGGQCYGLSRSRCVYEPECQLVECPGCRGEVNETCVPAGAEVGCPTIGCGGICENLGPDECKSTPGCFSYGCPDCYGGEGFIGCYSADAPPPPVACAPCPGSYCQGLDEGTCYELQSKGCTPVYCEGCDFAGTYYAGCYGPNEGIPACAGERCLDSCYNLDVDSCSRRADCRLDGCPDCSGRADYYCVNATDPPAPCPAIACEDCYSLDERSCGSRPECRPDYCPTCDGAGRSYFAGCSYEGDPFVGCPDLCPQGCEALGELDCLASSSCHAVYDNFADCDCAAPGCCTFFSYCATGQANCSGPAFCDSIPPACEGPFTVGYSNGCWEGCVRAAECAE